MANTPAETKADYASAIRQAVERAQNDPSQLRSLIYAVARLTLGKHILANYAQLGSAALQHMQELETAIDQVELLAQQPSDPAAKKAILEPPAAAPTQNVLTVYNPSLLTITGGGRSENPSMPTMTSSEAPLEDHQIPNVLQRSDVDTPTLSWEPSPSRTNIPWNLLVAVVAGAALCALFVVLVSPLSRPSPQIATNASIISQGVTNASVPPDISATSLSARFAPLMSAATDTANNTLGFALPTVYGVYAVNVGTPYELDPLPIKVPDARIAISAMISTPSHVTLPNGNLSFVIFRRDLVSNAPIEAFVRVVAQVEREMKFGAAGPTTTKVDGQWAVRSKSYAFRVAPVSNSPEMIVLRPEDPQLVLSPGRYALVVAGQGYDFTVAGKMTDTAECLERSEIVGGSVYSECRTLP